jgi:hypothetical protein
MPRSITRVAPMRRILTVAEPEVMVQLVRLIVLYEDLKLEVAGLHSARQEVRRGQQALPAEHGAGGTHLWSGAA